MENYKSNVLNDTDLILADLQNVLAMAEGRRFVRRIFDNCGVFASLSITEPLLTAYQEGRRSVGLGLFEQVKCLNVNYITKLLQEDINNV